MYIRGGFSHPGPARLGAARASEAAPGREQSKALQVCGPESGPPRLNPNSALMSQRLILGLKEIIYVKCLKECLAQSECCKHVTVVAFMKQRRSRRCRAGSAARSPRNGVGVPAGGGGRRKRGGESWPLAPCPFPLPVSSGEMAERDRGSSPDLRIPESPT